MAWKNHPQRTLATDSFGGLKKQCGGDSIKIISTEMRTPAVSVLRLRLSNYSIKGILKPLSLKHPGSLLAFVFAIVGHSFKHP